MKRGTPEHPKTLMLAAELDLPGYAAVGVLESLWHITSRYAPAGDIGKYPNSVIAQKIEWDRDADELVEALVKTRWLDHDDDHRLLVHDWPDHADDAVNMHLARARQVFACGRAPKTTRLPKVEKKNADEWFKNTGVHKACTRRVASPPLPSPALPSPPKPSARAVPVAVAVANGSASPSGTATGTAGAAAPKQEPTDVEVRNEALANYQAEIEPLVSPKPRQADIDRRIARKWFNTCIWPRKMERTEGEARLRIALAFVDRASDADKPMAKLTGLMQEHLGAEGG